MWLSIQLIKSLSLSLSLSWSDVKSKNGGRLLCVYSSIINLDAVSIFTPEFLRISPSLTLSNKKI